MLSVLEAGLYLELLTLRPLPPRGWAYRRVLPCQVPVVLGIAPRLGTGWAHAQPHTWLFSCTHSCSLGHSLRCPVLSWNSKSQAQGPAGTMGEWWALSLPTTILSPPDTCCLHSRDAASLGQPQSVLGFPKGHFVSIRPFKSRFLPTFPASFVPASPPHTFG